MKISIIVPVYNAEKYIDECISSVLQQTNPNWELILVDDGSTDNSSNIIDEYADKDTRIKSYHKRNEGQFLTRQFGIDKASGDYLGFLDADDFLSKEYVSAILEVCEKHLPDVICFEYCQWNKTITKEWILSLPIKNDCFYCKPDTIKQVYSQIIDGSLTGSMWSKAFSSELIKNTKIDSNVVRDKRFAEDAYHSYSIIAKAESIYYLKENLYYYRENNDSASGSLDTRPFSYFNQKFLFELILNLLSFWKMDDNDNMNRLLAFNFNYTVNYILKFYRAAQDFSRRREVVNYDWSAYLLDMNDDSIKGNPYIRKSYIKVWYAFKSKKHFEIYIRESIKKIGWG